MALLHQISDGGGGGPEDDGPEILHFRSINSLLDGPEDKGGGGGGGGGDRGQRALALLLGADSPRSSVLVQDRRPPRLPLQSVSQEQYPSSPEVAQTPRSLVPATCFPSRHSVVFSSYSELGSGLDGASEQRVPPSAPSGGGAEGVSVENALNDLVHSLTNISIGSLGSHHSYPSMGDIWASDVNGLDVPRSRNSYCGESGARVTWSGKLPPRCADTHAGFSPKVFLGGLPWDITEEALLHTFRQYHPLRVEWPGKEGGRSLCAGAPGGAGAGGAGGASPRGYVYMTFESERRVRALLAASTRDHNNWYYRVSSRKMRHKEVQVIPWAVADSNYVVSGSVKLDPARTVFVGALHGMLCARALATIMQDLFSGVVYAGIDTDKNKYPIGSGRVTFNNRHSYIRAVNAAFIEIRTEKFIKKVQVDPYLEDSMCSMCNMQGPYFCREPSCFSYFCRACWFRQHKNEDHKPLTRHKTQSQSASGGAGCPGGHGGSGGPSYARGAVGHPSAPVGATSGPAYANGPHGGYTQNGLPYNSANRNGPVYTEGLHPMYASGPVGAATESHYPSQNGPYYSGQKSSNYSAHNGPGGGQQGSNFSGAYGETASYYANGPPVRSNYAPNGPIEGPYSGNEAGYSSASCSPPGSSRSTADSY